MYLRAAILAQGVMEAGSSSGPSDGLLRKAAAAWARSGAGWQKRCLIAPGDEASGSWLRFVKETGLGCTVCHAAGHKNGWGLCQIIMSTGLHWHRVLRHAESSLHRQALEQRQQKDGMHIMALGSPSKLHFQKVLEAGATKGGMPGIGERKKVRRMQWCLAEARRRFNQAFWRRCGSMSIAQDKRGTRLLIRWRAATPELQMRSGIMGLSRDVPDAFEGVIGSDATLAATTYALLEACAATEPPYIVDPPLPPVDPVLYEKLQDIIEVFAADAASDEQLVGREMSAKFKTDANALQPVLPNVMMVGRDPSHAAKRSLSRPWGTDEYLRTVMSMFIDGPESICKIIQFSPVIGKWFHSAVQKMELPLKVSGAIKDLSWAKQRYDGVARPLGRSVMCLAAQNAKQILPGAFPKTQFKTQISRKRKPKRGIRPRHPPETQTKHNPKRKLRTQPPKRKTQNTQPPGPLRSCSSTRCWPRHP